MVMERRTLKIPDKVRSEQYASFGRMVIEKKLTPEWRMETVSEGDRTMTFVRSTDISTVEKSTDGKIMVINLPDSLATPGAAERASTSFADAYPGYSLYRFMPHLKKAYLKKLPSDVLATRAAVASVLGVKPWDITVERRRGGGYVISDLPSTYMPSRHDDKLDEVAKTKIPGGQPGWFARIDGRTLTGEIIPAELPTFPTAIPTNMDALGKDLDHTTYGMKLPDPGQEEGEPAVIDWTASAAMLLGGTPGSGKRQPLTARIPVPVSQRFPDGWATMADMRKGDTLYGRDGSVITVEHATRVTTRPTWRFTFADGQTVDSDSEHLWAVSTRWTRHGGGAGSRVEAIRERVVPRRDERLDVFDLAALFSVNVDVVRAAVDDLRLHSTSGLYTVSKLEKRLLGEDEKNDVVVKTTDDIAVDVRGGSFSDYAVPVAKPIMGGGAFDWKEQLDRVRSGKALEPAALRGDLDSRRLLLRGLVHEFARTQPSGEIIVMSPAPESSDSILELVRSMGLWAVRDERGIHFTSHYDLGRGIPRVKDVQRWNRIVDVTYLGETPGRCLKVDAEDHLYLTEDFIPTHNTVTLNVILADWLASGAECVVVDDPAKSVDFMWAKPFLRKGGWGCDSDRHAVAALALAYEEGQRRAGVLKERGFVNWLDMPAKDRFTPISIIVDELSAITVADPVPKGVPKDSAIYMEIAEGNFQKAMLMRYITKIIAEERFVGVRIILSTQVTNAATGVAPSTKAKIGHKVLQGSAPSKSARQQAFSVEDRVPQIPGNVAGGGKRAKGVGAAELEGVTPFVYKAVFAMPQAYSDHLKKLGIATHSESYVTPTGSDLARYAPTLEDEVDTDDGPAPSKFDAGGFGDPGGDVGELKGAAKANHDRAVEMAQARVAARKDQRIRDVHSAISNIAEITRVQDGA